MSYDWVRENDQVQWRRFRNFVTIIIKRDVNDFIEGAYVTARQIEKFLPTGITLDATKTTPESVVGTRMFEYCIESPKATPLFSNPISKYIRKRRKMPLYRREWVLCSMVSCESVPNVKYRRATLIRINETAMLPISLNQTLTS